MTDRRVIFPPPEYWTTQQPEETTVPEIEFDDVTPAYEASRLLIPNTEPGMIFTSPRPGLEGIGIVINDTRHGSHTLLLTPGQAAFIAQQIAIGLANLDAMRAEVLYRGEPS